jgi:hypothetical protein
MAPSFAKPQPDPALRLGSPSWVLSPAGLAFFNFKEGQGFVQIFFHSISLGRG